MNCRFRPTMVFYAGKLIKEIIRMCSISYRVELLTMFYMTGVDQKKKELSKLILHSGSIHAETMQYRDPERLCATFSVIVYHFCSNCVTFKM